MRNKKLGTPWTGGAFEPLTWRRMVIAMLVIGLLVVGMVYLRDRQYREQVQEKAHREQCLEHLYYHVL